VPSLSDIKHPLKRDGNSQTQRTLSALEPKMTPVDGRTTMDMLHYLARFSREVLYYDLKGNTADWSAFFRHSVPFRLAFIAQFDPEKWWNEYLKCREQIIVSANTGSLELIIGHLFAAFVQHQNWHWDLRKDTTNVSQTVVNLTATNVRYLLIEFLGIQNVLIEKYDLITDNNSEFFLNTEGFKRYETAEYGDSRIDKMWDITLDDVQAKNFALSAKRGTRETILPALLPQLDRIAELIYKAQLTIVASFPKDNTDSLIINDEKHEPHLALLFAFIRLFKEVQNDLNKLTERQLSFFYEKVLLFQQHEAVPDKAHLVFELARQMGAAHLLKDKTRYKAGKDANKQEIQFGLDGERVVNRAEVAEVRTLFFSGQGGSLEINRPFIKPIEKGLASESWASFGAANTEGGRVGWVLSASVLWLREGVRTVSLDITFTTNFTIFSSITDLQKGIQVEYSTKDKWEKAILTTNNGGHAAIAGSSQTGNKLVLTFQLDDKAKPFEPLMDKELNPYGSDMPMLRIQMKEDALSSSAYAPFINDNIQNCAIKIGVKGLKTNLTVLNTEGGIEPSRPFQPFGLAAASSLWLGSEEFDDKTLTDLRINTPIQEKTQSDYDKIYNLYSSIPLINTATVKADIFGETSSVATSIGLFSGTWDVVNIPRKLPKLNKLNRNSLLKISIEQVDFFKFNEYPLVLQRQSTAASVYPYKYDGALYLRKSDGVKGTIPLPTGTYIGGSHVVLLPEEPPYNPTATGISIDYEAIATSIEIQYARLMPFINGFEKLTGLNTPLFAKPIQDIEPAKPLAEGNLYIGLKHITASSTVALLFQFSEYSGNPDLPLRDIYWYCLQADNTWKALQRDVDFQDTTIPSEYDSSTGLKPKSFVQSGIITFTLPQEAALTHSTFPEGMVWLRAAVNQYATAFDKLIGIHAQAAQTRFIPLEGSDLTRLSVPFAAKKIAKPLVEDAVISKIEQLYPSFGGIAKEDPIAFRRRVSEKLRHKGRAVTILDYELLVLQQFPIIYKAKCLSHTQLLLNRPNYDLLERSGNNIALVVVPDVSQLPAAAREEPKANQETLANIKAFLDKRRSYFAHIEVVNPQYQPVGVHFKVKFRIGKDPAFYRTELEKEIKAFLSPWMRPQEDGKQSAEIQFGGVVEKSSVLKFIEERTYVDYIEDFYLFDTNILTPLNQIEANTARSVLAAGEVVMFTIT
jgi:hypothetical protein